MQRWPIAIADVGEQQDVVAVLSLQSMPGEVEQRRPVGVANSALSSDSTFEGARRSLQVTRGNARSSCDIRSQS
jgi:hypothetical protein